MKHYQDTQTGQIYAFEDDFNPFISDNRNIPKTLTDVIKNKPTDTSVWYWGDWIEKSDAPFDYIEPISSVPSYNPAWMVHLRPYSAIVNDSKKQISLSLEQINENSYVGMELSEVVGILPLGINEGLDALVSYDGAIAIPQCNSFSTRSEGIAKLNEILCSLLLGGIHAEVLHSHELEIGSLYEKTTLFSYTPSLHTRLRLNWASITERLEPLMSPRVLSFGNIEKSFFEGQDVIKSLTRFTPFFLINGYTSLINQNNNDALNNLWIVVEQLTEILWINIYKKQKFKYPLRVQKCHTNLKGAINRKSIHAKHKLLRLSKIITRDTYKILDRARDTRNDLAHRGLQADRKVIIELWDTLSELFEIATSRENLGIRALKVGGEINWDIPSSTNFNEWQELAISMK
ncbi:hypothetical protein [Acinetobacter sp. ANC 4862]|jgi:hypothetical protein|uniref:hypothetical protein n=1 Tax=Acinetobacter sp. ANC 4862 TaxID=2529849 RepID=UPI00103DCB30|nr:hypothetical protein [Acinetobacter sp. ANC 4862]TCH65391.1 hypothetical protein E0409_01330 [Acinetobacter sp. ANC 4862]